VGKQGHGGIVTGPCSEEWSVNPGATRVGQMHRRVRKCEVPGNVGHKDAAFPPTQARRGFDRDSESIPHQPAGSEQGLFPPPGPGVLPVAPRQRQRTGRGQPLEALIASDRLRRRSAAAASALPAFPFWRLLFQDLAWPVIAGPFPFKVISPWRAALALFFLISFFACSRTDIDRRRRGRIVAIR